MKEDFITKKERKRLNEMRVIKKNLLYITGLPENMACEEELRKNYYLG